MSSADIIDLCSDDDGNGEVDVKAVKLEPDLVVRLTEQNIYNKTDLDQHNKSQTHYRRQESEENRSSSALSTGQSGISVLDREQSPLVDDGSLCSTLPICSAPLCRQFWKAGNYIDVPTPMSALQNGTSHLRIHPRFLHSNATSHKWAFGAIAELLDNAVDEIQNGATFVIIDKTLNPRNGASALLIQDDGGGMDPEAMRRCLSFGFSIKKSKSAIGQYGNGFKTSSMRLGADVIVFSRHCKNRNMTQSIGLLSYTFLTQAGHDRIVVPMVDYEFNSSTGTLHNLHWQTKENCMYNLSILLQWSPYSTENELMKQFDDIGYHGTKIIIYNLWFNDENTMELDFESDPKDIYIAGEAKIIEKGGLRMAATDQHIANRLRYSLRAYLSVLYLRIPESFCILLRGQVVEYHNIASDLKFPEFIKYSPHNGGCVEGTIITTIGFLKEAPLVSIHGFNVYHKNRLVLPFWRTVSLANSRGRGVVGVLEANFIVPTHNKQDFEKTTVFQKLEIRLKEMTLEYWDYHCELIGYHAKKKPQVPNPSSNSSDFMAQHGPHEPVVLSRSFCAAGRTHSELEGGTFLPLSAVSLVGRQGPLISSQRNLQEGACLKRKGYDRPMEPEKVIWKGAKANAIDTGSSQEVEPATSSGKWLEDKEAINLMQENKKLRARCLENEKREEELKIMVIQLRTELGEAQGEYARLLAESQFLDKVKEENKIYLL